MYRVKNISEAEGWPTIDMSQHVNYVRNRPKLQQQGQREPFNFVREFDLYFFHHYFGFKFLNLDYNNSFSYCGTLIFGTYLLLELCLFLNNSVNHLFISFGLSNALAIIAFGPITEELFKEFSGFRFVFPICEFLMTGATWFRVPAVLFHYGTASWPFHQRLHSHMAWNFCAVILEIVTRENVSATFFTDATLLQFFLTQLIAFVFYFLFNYCVRLLDLHFKTVDQPTDLISYIIKELEKSDCTIELVESPRRSRIRRNLRSWSPIRKEEFISIPTPKFVRSPTKASTNCHACRQDPCIECLIKDTDPYCPSSMVFDLRVSHSFPNCLIPFFNDLVTDVEIMNFLEQHFYYRRELIKQLDRYFAPLRPVADFDDTGREPALEAAADDLGIPDIQDSIDSNSASTVALIVNFIRDMEDSGNAQAIQLFIHSITSAGIIYRGDTITRVLSIVNFINGLTVKQHRDTLFSLLGKVCTMTNDFSDKWESKVYSRLTPTSASDDKPIEDSPSVSNILSHISELGGHVPDSVTIAIQKVFACAIASNMFGESTDDAHWAGIMTGILDSKELERAHSPNKFEMARILRSTFSSIITAIKAAFMGLEKDEFSCQDPCSWMRCARWLIQFEFLRYRNGDETPGYVSDDLWRRNLDTCYDQYDKVMPKDAIQRSVMQPLYARVAEMRIASWCAKYGNRPMPFNIGLFSQPGTGKSTWIAEAFAFIALTGLKIRHDCETLDAIKKIMVVINQGDKFLSAYDPSKDAVAVFDEVGSTRADRDQENVLMQNITSVLGENNWFPTRASLQEKGKILYQPHVNILLTNTHPKDIFGVKEYITNPEAFVRRMHVVFEVRIKAEFKAEGAHGLNFEKVQSREDKWDVITFHPFKSTYNGFEETGEVLSFTQACDYVTLKAGEHLNKKDGLISVRSQVSDLTSRVCKHSLFHCDECGSYDDVPLTPTSAGDFTDAQVFFNNQDQISYHYIGFLMALLWCGTFLFRSAAEKFELYKLERDSLRRDLESAQQSLSMANALVTRFKRVKDETLSEADHFDKVIIRTEKLIDRIGKIREAKFKMTRDSMWSLLTAASCFLASYGVYKLVTYDNKKLTPVMNSQIQGTPGSSKLKGNPWDLEEGYIHAGPASVSGIEPLMKKIKRNLIEIEFSGSPRARVHALGIFGPYALVNWHAAKYFSAGTHTCSVIQYPTRDNGCSFRFNMLGSPKLVEKIGEDLAIVRLVDAHTFADIRRYIPEKAQYSGGIHKVQGINVHYRNAAPHDLMRVPFTGYFTNKKSYNDRDREYTPPGFFGEHPHPYDGHCGSPLITVVGNQVHLNGVVCAASLTQKMSLFHTISMTEIRKGVKELENRSCILAPMSGLSFDESPAMEGHEITEKDERTHAHHAQDEMGSIESDGCMPNASLRTAQSTVYKYPLHDKLFEEFPKEYHHDLIAPVFKHVVRDGEYLSPERNALKDMSRQVSGIDIDFLNLAVKDLVEKFKECEDFKKLRILPLDECLNGDGFGIKSMPKNTSAGFPDGGKKYVHLDEAPTDKHPHGVKLNPEMQAKFDDMLKKACSGVRNGIVYKTCAKDEPRSAQKVADRRIRIFTLGPMNFYLLCKKFYGSFMSAYIANFLTTETVGGVNCFSKDWGRIFKRLMKHPYVVNGDYKKFDKKISTLMIMAAATVVVELFKWSFLEQGEELSQEAINALTSIASDIASPLILMNRDLLRPAGSLSSGVLMTFIFNDIINSLYMRLAFYTLRTAVSPIDDESLRKLFRDNVELFTAGDDNTYSLSEEVRPFFNFSTIQKYFRSIGMAYTPADKSDNVYGTVDVEKATICKRSWRYDKEFQIWTCPIEKQSILKMLTIGLRSSAITETEHEQQCFRAAQCEFAQYGREEFRLRTETLRSLRPSFKYLSYEEIMEKQKEDGITPWIPETLESFPDVELDAVGWC